MTYSVIKNKTWKDHFFLTFGVFTVNCIISRYWCIFNII